MHCLFLHLKLHCREWGKKEELKRKPKKKIKTIFGDTFLILKSVAGLLSEGNGILKNIPLFDSIM